VKWSAGVATVVALAITTTMLVGLVSLVGGGAATTRETGALDPNSLTFANPFGGGVVSIGILRGPETSEGAPLSVARFAAVVYTLGPIGWLLEALVTAAVLGYVARVRPQLVFGGALALPARGPAGDEGVA